MQRRLPVHRGIGVRHNRPRDLCERVEISAPNPQPHITVQEAELGGTRPFS